MRQFAIHPNRSIHGAKDNRYLELALAAAAATIVSGDGDLPIPHPWRGVRILLPAAYLAEAEGDR